MRMKSEQPLSLSRENMRVNVDEDMKKTERVHAADFALSGKPAHKNETQTERRSARDRGSIIPFPSRISIFTSALICFTKVFKIDFFSP